MLLKLFFQFCVFSAVSACATSQPVVEERYVPPTQNSSSELDSKELLEQRPEGRPQGDAGKVKLVPTCVDEKKNSIPETDPAYKDCLSRNGSTTGVQGTFGK